DPAGMLSPPLTRHLSELRDEATRDRHPKSEHARVTDVRHARLIITRRHLFEEEGAIAADGRLHARAVDDHADDPEPGYDSDTVARINVHAPSHRLESRRWKRHDGAAAPWRRDQLFAVRYRAIDRNVLIGDCQTIRVVG